MNEVEIVERITKLEAHNQVQDEQIKYLKDITSEIRSMSESLIKLTEQMTNTSDDVKEIKNEVNVLKEKPAGKWEKISLTAATSIVSGIIALAISLIFK